MFIIANRYYLDSDIERQALCQQSVQRHCHKRKGNNGMVSELYRQNARTFSPRLTSSSVRWLPIKPSAPVTITECAIVCSFIQGDSAPYFTLLQNSITDFGEDFNCKLRIVNGRLRGKPLRPRRLGQLPAQRGAFSRGLRPRKRPPLSGEVAERQRWPEGLWPCPLQRIIQNLRQKIPTTLLTCGKFRVTI